MAGLKAQESLRNEAGNPLSINDQGGLSAHRGDSYHPGPSTTGHATGISGHCLSEKLGRSYYTLFYFAFT
jgi:hypothetical protein